ncbi:MAG: hypothetical protein ACWA6U_05450 [Breznakibacter sp.]
MKKFLFYFMMASAFTFASCSDDDEDDANVLAGNELKSDITTEVRLDPAVKYNLTGTVNIKSGGKLIIPAGTTIQSESGFAAYILVEQGGKIEANGTASAPIRFTSSKATPKAGDWGGIIINGYAPISGATAGTISATEVDNSKPYGGNNPSDNSGVLRYVTIEYSGARSSADIEHNGLTLNGVGNGTVIENIYVLEGSDDGVEFFGGSVNVTNLLVVNSDDDMFDFTQGYTGALKNCFGIWEAAFTSTEKDPRGIEADGNLDGKGPDHVGQSAFKIENMTIVNNSAYIMDDVIKIRRNATATITNALVKGTGPYKDFFDGNDSAGAGNGATSANITKSITGTMSGVEINGTFPNVKIGAGNAGCSTALFAWTKYAF